MKKLVNVALAVAMTSSVAFAGNESRTEPDICRGEVTKNIVDAIKSCSPDEISRSLYEIKVLEADIAATEKQLEEASSREGDLGLSYNEVASVKSYAIMALTIGGSSAGLAFMEGFAFDQANGRGAYFKGSLITTVMGAVAYMAANQEKASLEIKYKDIPVLKTSLKNMKNELRIRKAILERSMYR